jgi:GDP-L-fucose synthase
MIGNLNMTRWLVAGASGMVGRAVVRNAKNRGVSEIIEVTSKSCDLTNLQKTRQLLLETKPDVVIDAAAKVGGIFANSAEPVEFMVNNLQIQINLFSASHEANVKKVVFLSSSCVYPKYAQQPIKESSLLSGPLEETNSAYALAKISGMRLIQAYRQQYGRKWISVMPTNLYGAFDNFSLNSSHVLPALIRKFHDAKEENKKMVLLWGSGTPKREFMEVDDFANALALIIDNYENDESINVGVGEDQTISEVAEIVKQVVGFKGDIIWDQAKPDGTPRKLLDITKLKNLGFVPSNNLIEGVTKTYAWFLDRIGEKSPDLRL